MTDLLTELERLAKAAVPDSEYGYDCARCHESYSLRENCDPSKYCDRCVHDVVDSLEETVVKLIAALRAAKEMREVAGVRFCPALERFDSALAALETKP